MSATTHRVITHHVSGSVNVHPSSGKLLSKKDAQRMASALMAAEFKDVQHKVVMTEVVDVVQVAHVS